MGVRVPIPWKTVLTELQATEEDFSKALRAMSDGRADRADIVFVDRDHIVLGERWIVKKFRYRLNRNIRRINKRIWGTFIKA